MTHPRRRSRAFAASFVLLATALAGQSAWAGAPAGSAAEAGGARVATGAASGAAEARYADGAAAAAAEVAAAVTGPALSVNASADRHAINPGIYGMSFVDRSRASVLGVTVDRFGGNSTSRFDYLTSSYNTGSDWYYENIPPTASGVSGDDIVTQDQAAGLQTLLTVPTIGWVSKAPVEYDHPYACGFARSAFPNQDSFDPWDANCGNGTWQGHDIAPTSSSAGYTSQVAGPSWDEAWVQRLVAAYGTAAHGGVQMYELDNEPALWNSTHRDVHPAPLDYAAYAGTAIAAAKAIKAADPTALVVGPSDWGWCAYFYSPADPGGCSDGSDRQAHGDVPLGAWYLQQFKAASDQAGVRLLDVFDEHYYPQAAGIALSPAGGAATQALRLRSTRSLWDPTYKDESWISDLAPGGVAVDLIPRLRAWIDANDPGTKLAISEYNFGGLESINGALAQADVLGIFARERVDLAALWGAPAAGSPGEFAFRMFRNYDGAGGTFGDTWVRSTSGDQSKLAVYGAQRGAKGSLTTVVINKTGSARTSRLAVSGFAARGDVQVWRYAPADLAHIVRGSDAHLTGGAVTLTYPANSITMLVLPPKDGAAPTVTSGPQPRLRAFVALGGRQTSLTWAATDNRRVERYQLQRSVGGGAWTQVALGNATVPHAAVSLSPGTTYRYRVRALDGAGNTSTWVAGPAFSESVVQDSSSAITYSGSWSVDSAPGASGGTLHDAAAGGTTPAATLTFTGRAVAYVAERRTSDDMADVLIDGQPVATRSLQSFAGGDHSLDSTVPQQLVLVRTWGARGAHTITVRGQSIDLDAFLVLDTP